MIFDEPITFLEKNGSQKLVFQCIGIDDMGFIMQPPIGESVDASILGEILADPGGIDYKIKSIAIHQNLLWLEYVDING